MVKQTINLFLDDERFPPNDGKQWLIVRNILEVQEVFLRGDIPDFISFDHDLGENEPTGFDIVKWICEYDMDHNVLGKDFSWYTHSQNPIGKKNIDCYISQYLKVK